MVSDDVTPGLSTMLVNKWHYSFSETWVAREVPGGSGDEGNKLVAYVTFTAAGQTPVTYHDI